jgi:hypothetical protein
MTKWLGKSEEMTKKGLNILAVLVIFLIISVSTNIYLLASFYAAQSSALPYASGSMNLGGFSLSPNGSEAFSLDVNLKGTALITGDVFSTAPIDFSINYKGNAGPYAFEALNTTMVNIRVLLPKGLWSFDFVNSGVNATVTSAPFYINYSYFG